MTVEEYFKEWWTSKLPENWFNKTAMLDFAEMYYHEKEAQRVVKNITYEPVLATVPYQCCPVCGGTGQTIADGLTSSVYQTCKVCNGACVIPQHIVQQALGIDS